MALTQEAVPVARELGAADEELDVDDVGEAVVLMEGPDVVFEVCWVAVEDGVVDSIQNNSVGERPRRNGVQTDGHSQKVPFKKVVVAMGRCSSRLACQSVCHFKTPDRNLNNSLLTRAFLAASNLISPLRSLPMIDCSL